MTWQSLTQYARALHATYAAIAKDPVQRSEDLRLRAAHLAHAHFGEARLMDQPATVNVAALALQTRAHLVMYELDRTGRRVVDETDLHSLPDEAPRLLRGPWIVEVAHPETDRILGQTASLAGYPLGESVFLVGLDWPDGIKVARWTPQWTGGEIEAGVPREDSPLIDDVDAHHAWAQAAARFAVVFGLLLDVASSPLRVYDPRPHAGRRMLKAQRGRDREWTVRRVILDPQRRVTRRAPPPSDVRVERGELDEAVVPVRGHLRRQVRGPGRSEREWIWIEGYEARRWVAPRVRVVVRGPANA